VQAEVEGQALGGAEGYAAEGVAVGYDCDARCEVTLDCGSEVLGEQG
jgi:hypothetical protein